MLLTILTWIIVGAIAGWLASIIMGTDASQGMVANILVGILGAFIGGFLYSLLFRGDVAFPNAITGFNVSSLILSTIGAIVLLALMKMFRGNRRTL